MIALNGSTKNDKGMFKLPALIQSNRNISCDFCELPESSAKMPTLIAKEMKITPLPISAIRLLDNVFLPNPLITKPSRGINGTSQTKFIILLIFYSYHLRRFNTLISIDWVFLYTITIILKPTATSAAAKAIMKNTNTCPDGSL